VEWLDLLDMISAGAPTDRHVAIDAKARAQSLLTPREQEVLLLLKEGLKNSEISDRLVISPQTAKHHLSSIYNKLGVKNRTRALTKAVELGLVNLE
jgi:DNA-binding NarL/FixJ family response regulator